jgi:methionine sulfoxide reductase heme-binding subunit
MMAWELTRASAFVAFGCYTLSVVWGITLASRSFPAPMKPEFDYHRFLSTLGFVAMLVHISTVLWIHANHVHWPAIVYIHAAPAATAGVSAMWLAILLPLSFRLKQRKRLSAGTWRSLHYLGYVVWGLALLHGLGAGTDTQSRLVMGAYAGAAALVAAATVWRLTGRRSVTRANATE